MDELTGGATNRSSLDEINEFAIENGDTRCFPKTNLLHEPTQQQPYEEWDPTQHAYDEEIVDIRLVQPNDTVKVLRGASIPADGVVSHGEMTVDESMVRRNDGLYMCANGPLIHQFATWDL